MLGESHAVPLLDRASACACAALLCILLGTQGARADSEEKVQICHFPLENPDHFHTLIVGAPAISAHLAHGDTLGACENSCGVSSNLCDDGDACTAEVCDPATGACLPQVPVDCDDGNVCTLDSCNSATGECANLPRSGESCDDGDACTDVDRCDGQGGCAGTAIPDCCAAAAECDDQNPCTDDACSASRCSHSPVACDDANACTADACNAADGSCVSAPVVCSDADPCTVDVCDPLAGCQHQPTSCECTPGSGTGGEPCSDLLPCCDERMDCGADGSCQLLCMLQGSECGGEVEGSCCPGLTCWLGTCDACLTERNPCDESIPCCAGLMCDPAQRMCRPAP